MSFQPWQSNHHDWDNYEMKFDQPLRSMAAVFPPESHAAKLDFRLTVPVVAHVLGLHRWGVRALYLALTIGTLWLCYSLFLEWSRDKAAASLFAIGIAAIPPGSEVFFGRFFYDPAAFFLGVACLKVTRWWMLAPLLFALAFVDERALLMFPAIWLHHSAFRKNATPLQPIHQSRTAGWCALSVLAAYFLTRAWLTKYYGLRIPLSDAGIGFKCLDLNYRFLQLMSLATLEFFWLLLLPLLWKLWSDRARAAGLLYILCLAAPLCASLLVLDVGRSMNYVFPAFVSLIGLLPVFYQIDTLRSMLLAVAVLNLLFWNVDYVNTPRPGMPAVLETPRLLIKKML